VARSQGMRGWPQTTWSALSAAPSRAKNSSSSRIHSIHKDRRCGPSRSIARRSRSPRGVCTHKAMVRSAEMACRDEVIPRRLLRQREGPWPICPGPGPADHWPSHGRGSGRAIRTAAAAPPRVPAAATIPQCRASTRNHPPGQPAHRRRPRPAPGPASTFRHPRARPPQPGEQPGRTDAHGSPPPAPPAPAPAPARHNSLPDAGHPAGTGAARVPLPEREQRHLPGSASAAGSGNPREAVADARCRGISTAFHHIVALSDRK
jgi:hypothetical protein